MRLFHNAVSSNARRVMLAAIHMGTPLDTTEVNLMDPADRRRLEELNPNSKLPVLQDGDFVLWESCAIMQYLADRTFGQTLYPDNVVQRADINRWMFWACQHFSPALGIIVWENIWKGVTGNGGPDPAAIARAAVDVKKFATVLDKQLAGRQWVLGDSLTLADFALAAPLMYTDQARLPVTEYANLQAWYARVQELDAWKQTQPVW
jgi:glutathione S-transferase